MLRSARDRWGTTRGSEGARARPEDWVGVAGSSWIAAARAGGSADLQHAPRGAGSGRGDRWWRDGSGAARGVGRACSAGVGRTSTGAARVSAGALRGSRERCAARRGARPAGALRGSAGSARGSAGSVARPRRDDLRFRGKVTRPLLHHRRGGTAWASGALLGFRHGGLFFRRRGGWLVQGSHPGRRRRDLPMGHGRIALAFGGLAARLAVATSPHEATAEQHRGRRDGDPAALHPRRGRGLGLRPKRKWAPPRCR